MILKETSFSWTKERKQKIKGHVLLHRATCSELGNTTYVQFLSDQENIYTKRDVNKYSSEVLKCMIPLHACDNSTVTFCLIPILMFSAKFQSLYYFNRLLFLKLGETTVLSESINLFFYSKT